MNTILRILKPFYGTMLAVLLACSLAFQVGCAGVTLASVTTTAENLIGQGAAYVETLGNMLSTGTAKLATTASAISQLATSWGLLPASSSQATTFAKVISVMQAVSTDSAAAASVVASLQSNGTIPTASTTGTTTTLQWETPKGTVYFCKDNATGATMFYSLPGMTASL